MTRKRAHSPVRSLISAAAFGLIPLLCAYAVGVEAAEQKPWPQASYFTVVARPDDTVETIGARYRMSASVVAKFNGMDTTTPIRSGQLLRIPAGGRATREAVLSEAMDRSARNYAPAPKSPDMADRSIAMHASPRASERRAPPGPRMAQLQSKGTFRFAWPISGPVISSFGPDAQGARNDGINIAVARGLPFRAAASGRISYAGSLRGYGNLIIITHPDGFVTAYAHADDIAVSRGEDVAKGQVIGTTGETGGVDRPQLHFEIRRGVKPVDPERLLAAES